MKAAKCNSCGANITIDETKDYGVCEYCNTPYYKETSKTKFCKYCGEKISEHAVICVHCGSQVEELQRPQPQVQNNYIPQPQNNYNNPNDNRYYFGNKRPINKWISLLLCIFLGTCGAHKFYEGKFITGLLYLFTMGLFGVGWFIDIILILLKPNPYFV